MRSRVGMGNRSRGKEKAKQITLFILSGKLEGFPFSRWGNESRAAMKDDPGPENRSETN